MNKVDFTKPLETTTSIPMTVVRPYPGGGFVLKAERPIRSNKGYGHGPGSTFVYNADGKHRYSSMPDVRNVAPKAPGLDVRQPLETMDGKPVRFVDYTSGGNLLVEVTYPGYPAVLELRRADGRKRGGIFTSGDDLRNKVVEQVTYVNVYADGSVGSTVHSTLAASVDRSKYGKVRIGALERRTLNGKLVSAKVIPSDLPTIRNREFPSGRPAEAGDFA